MMPCLNFSPCLQVQLLLQLSDLRLQGSHVGLVLGLDGSFQLLEFQFQLLVLTLQLAASPFQSLGGAALCGQLDVYLISLNDTVGV